MAFDGTNYLMVWLNQPGQDTTGPEEVYGQFINTSGSVVGTPFPINQTVTENILGLAYGGGNYLVVYTKEVNPTTADSVVYGRTVSPTGTVGNEIQISTGYGDFGVNSVAFDGTNFLVVWADDSNDYEVKGRFVSPLGILGTEFSINASTYPSDNPLTVAFDGTNYLVVWTDQVGVSGEWDIFGQLVSPSGTLVGSVISISTANGQQLGPSIAFDGTNYLVVWTDMRNDANKNWVCDSNEETCWDIYGQYVSTSGTLSGSEFVINNDAGNQLGFVTYGGGKYLVIINDGVTPDDPAVTDAYGIVSKNVYGVFVTP